jgi:hypothetical protein
MTQGDEAQVIVLEIELVDDPVVARSQAKLSTPLEPLMRKIFQTPSQFADFGLNSFSNRWWKLEENRVELAGVDLRRLAHRPLGLTNPNAALAQIRLTAFDAGDEVRIQFGLVFEVIGQPVHQLQRLLRGQLPHLGFNFFDPVHANSIPAPTG